MAAPARGLAFKIISCSLKGGQRGVWSSLEVKESQPLSQLLAKSATLWSPDSLPDHCLHPLPWAPGSWLFGRVAPEGRPGRPTPERRGRGQGGLRAEPSRVRSAPVSSGSPDTLGLDSRRPAQLLPGLPWPPRGWRNLIFQQILTDLEKLRHVTHIGCSSEECGELGMTITRIESTLPDTSVRTVRGTWTALGKATPGPQAPSASVPVCSALP